MSRPLHIVNVNEDKAVLNGKITETGRLVPWLLVSHGERS